MTVVSEEKMSQFCKQDGPGDQKRVKNENNCSGTSKTLYCDEKLSVSSEGSIGKLKKYKDNDVILPHPFPFPKNFTPDVEVAIRTGEVGRLARNSFLSSILHAVYSYKKYPVEKDFVIFLLKLWSNILNFILIRFEIIIIIDFVSISVLYLGCTY